MRAPFLPEVPWRSGRLRPARLEHFGNESADGAAEACHVSTMTTMRIRRDGVRNAHGHGLRLCLDLCRRRDPEPLPRSVRPRDAATAAVPPRSRSRPPRCGRWNRERGCCRSRGIPANKFFLGSVGIARPAGFAGQQDGVVFQNRWFGTCSFGRASGELLRLVVFDGFVVGEIRASRFAEAGEIFLVGLRGFVLGP